MHQQKHSTEKAHKCELCDREFNWTTSFRRHMKTLHDKNIDQEDDSRTHTRKRPYKCNICEKAFTEAATLKKHEKTHTGEQAHQCDICKKKFTRKNCLTSHMSIHTKERPHKCDLCDKTFRLRATLQVDSNKLKIILPIAVPAFPPSYTLTDASAETLHPESLQM